MVWIPVGVLNIFHSFQTTLLFKGDAAFGFRHLTFGYLIIVFYCFAVLLMSNVLSQTVTVNCPFNIPNEHILCCSKICVHGLHLSSLQSLTHHQLAFKGHYLMLLYLAEWVQWPTRDLFIPLIQLWSTQLFAGEWDIFKIPFRLKLVFPLQHFLHRYRRSFLTYVFTVKMLFSFQIWTNPFVQTGACTILTAHLHNHWSGTSFPVPTPTYFHY